MTEEIKNKNLITERLILKPINQAFIQFIFDSFTYEITKYMMPQPTENIEVTKKVVSGMMRQREEETDFIYAIINKENDEFLGLCGLHLKRENVPELGIWTKKEAHGNKFGREAISALIEFARENFKFSYLLYPVDKRNIASRKIPENLGGILQEVERIEKNQAGSDLIIIEYHIH